MHHTGQEVKQTRHTPTHVHFFELLTDSWSTQHLRLLLAGCWSTYRHLSKLSLQDTCILSCNLSCSMSCSGLSSPSLTCPVLCPTAMSFDRNVSLVSNYMRVCKYESVTYHEACACAFTLGVILPWQEVVRSAGSTKHIFDGLRTHVATLTSQVS